MNAFDEWNALNRGAAAALASCCGSPAWVQVLTERRPYADIADLLVDAETVWFGLPELEWLTAFAHHPRIGERKAEAASTAQFASWSGAEQGAALASLGSSAQRLADANREYEERFGFRYIVFASGRTAPELLQVLEARLRHTREVELQEAVGQQWAITRLRMSCWLGDQDQAEKNTEKTNKTDTSRDRVQG